AGSTDARGERGTVAQRPTFAITRSGHVDELGIDDTEIILSETATLRGARTETVEDDIGILDDLPNDVTALVGGDVDANAFLALHHLRAGGFGEGHHRSDDVALERFDFDDSGPEVGKNRGTVGCSE